MFRETDFSWQVLIYDDVVVMLQLQFIVPEEDTGGLHKEINCKKGLKMHNFVCVETFSKNLNSHFDYKVWLGLNSNLGKRTFQFFNPDRNPFIHYIRGASVVSIQAQPTYPAILCLVIIYFYITCV